MKARDVMVFPVITVKPHSSVEAVANLFLERQISGAPVVDDAGTLVGIITEGDLLFRSEIETRRPHPYWFFQLAKVEQLAAEFVKAHALLVADVMTRKVITAGPDTTLNEIAGSMASNSIKRVPIVHNGQLVGIISRANLIQALASVPRELDISVSDSAIRADLMQSLNRERWVHPSHLNIIVHDGVVELWGAANSDVEKQAIRVAAESTHGVRAVNDHLIIVPRVATEPERDIATR
jgi:CBS domain-containing protein